MTEQRKKKPRSSPVNHATGDVSAAAHCHSLGGITEPASKSNDDTSVSDDVNPERQGIIPALHSRAHACLKAADRVQYCFDLMAGNEWRSGKTDRELAAIWGVARATVWGYSTQASRLVKLQLGDPEELRNRLATLMMAVSTEAMNRTEETVTAMGDVVEVRKPDMRTALSALAEIRDTFGLKQQKHQVEHSYQEKSLDELLQMAAAHLAKLQGEPANTEASDDENPTTGHEGTG